MNGCSRRGRSLFSVFSLLKLLMMESVSESSQGVTTQMERRKIQADRRLMQSEKAEKRNGVGTHLFSTASAEINAQYDGISSSSDFNLLQIHIC